jgi:hypothetical protein
MAGSGGASDWLHDRRMSGAQIRWPACEERTVIGELRPAREETQRCNSLSWERTTEALGQALLVWHGFIPANWLQDDTAQAGQSRCDMRRQRGWQEDDGGVTTSAVGAARFYTSELATGWHCPGRPITVRHAATERLTGRPQTTATFPKSNKPKIELTHGENSREVKKNLGKWWG